MHLSRSRIPWLSLAISLCYAIVYALQYGPLEQGRNFLSPSLSQQWAGAWWGPLTSSFWLGESHYAWHSVIALIILSWNMERYWGRLGYALRFLATTLIAGIPINIPSLDGSLVNFQISYSTSLCLSAWLGFLLMGNIASSTRKLDINVYEKRFVILAAAILFISGSHFFTEDQLFLQLNSVTGSLFGLFAFWIVRFAQFFFYSIRLPKPWLAPSLSFVFAIGLFLHRIVFPSSDEWMLWRFDQGERSLAIQNWIKDALAQSPASLIQHDLALRKLEGVDGIPLNANQALSSILALDFNPSYIQASAKMGYFKDLPGNQALLLRELDSNHEFWATQFKIQILCGSRDSTLLNPQKGMELASSLINRQDWQNTSIMISLAACLSKLNRKAEADAWLSRAFAIESNNEWNWERQFTLSAIASSRLRLAQNQAIVFPEDTYLSKNQNSTH